MTLLKSNAGAAFLAILTFTTACWASENTHKTPLVDFRRVMELVPPTDYVPAIGSSYVNPKTLPMEPFLGYEESHRSVNVVCIELLSEVGTREAMINRGRSGTGVMFIQTDMDYNPVPLDAKVADHHIAQWLTSHRKEQGWSK